MNQNCNDQYLLSSSFLRKSYLYISCTHLLYVLKICTESGIMQITIFFPNKILYSILKKVSKGETA